MPRRSGKDGALKAETTTIRISPRLKYSVELLARRQHRTISSVVLSALDALFANNERPGLDVEAQQITGLAKTTWDPREPVRLINLANRAPELLTPDEEFIWAVLKDSKYRGDGRYGIDETRVTSEWNEIKQQAIGMREELE